MHEAIDIANPDGHLFDVVTESPYILYSNEQIWFPNVESVESRILWANDQELQGVGFWALGYENGVVILDHDGTHHCRSRHRRSRSW